MRVGDEKRDNERAPDHDHQGGPMMAPQAGPGAISCTTKVANPSSRRRPPSQVSRCSRAAVSAWLRSSTVGADRTAQSTSEPVQLNS